MNEDNALLDELREVDRLLPGLTDEAPPELVVARTLERVTDETPKKTEARRRRRGPPMWAGIAATLMLAGGVWAVMQTSGEIQGLFETADSEIAIGDGIESAVRRSQVGQGQRAPARISEMPAADMADPYDAPVMITRPAPERPPPPEEAATPAPMDREAYDHTPDNDWVHVADEALSTFSIDVDTASYANVRRFVQGGNLPPQDAVRIEELLNYFEYDYPTPEPDQDPPFSVVTEVGPAPWQPDHRLVHVGLQAAALPVDQIPARNLVFLLDVSGSMNNPDKLPLLKSALSMLVPQLGADDRVAIVVYAGAAGVVLPPTKGTDSKAILGAMDRLKAGGSTAGSAGIEKAYELARDSFVEGGVNRVILATDGDFNVGPSSQGELVRIIERERESGVFLTVLGFGTGNLQDSRMEALADHGNGNYAYIDSIREARKVLVTEAGSTLITVAKDVKIQVEFNPAEVEGYRLIGYTNRVLENRDFTDDKKDAGEVGAGHSVTALYEIVPAGGKVDTPDGTTMRYQKPKDLTVAAGSGELLTVRLRWKDPQGSKSREAAWQLTDAGSSLKGTSDDFRFSAAVAGWGMALRGSSHLGRWTFAEPAGLARGALGADEHGYRREAIELMELSAAHAELDTLR